MKKRILYSIMTLILILSACVTVYAKELEIIIRFQGNKETSNEIKTTKNAVPQGMATDGNYIYLVKNRGKKDKTADDVTYILKIKNPDTNKPKLILPKNSLKVGHANGMTYYKGYLYIASEGQELYKVKDAGGNNNTASENIEWNEKAKNNKKGTQATKKEKGTEEYTLEGTYSLLGNSGEKIKNIAHYYGDYFVVCLKSEYSGSAETRKNKLTYGIGKIEGKQFVIKKRFIVNENTYKCIQDIEYKNGELWIVTSDTHNDSSTGLFNHILRVELPSSIESVEDNKTYKAQYINKYDIATREKKSNGKWKGAIRELESVCIIGDKYFVWSNMIEGWNETLCRYKEKNARTKPEKP